MSANSDERHNNVAFFYSNVLLDEDCERIFNTFKSNILICLKSLLKSNN